MTRVPPRETSAVAASSPLSRCTSSSRPSWPARPSLLIPCGVMTKAAGMLRLLLRFAAVLVQRPDSCTAQREAQLATVCDRCRYETCWQRVQLAAGRECKQPRRLELRASMLLSASPTRLPHRDFGCFTPSRKGSNTKRLSSHTSDSVSSERLRAGQLGLPISPSKHGIRGEGRRHRRIRSRRPATARGCPLPFSYGFHMVFHQ